MEVSNTVYVRITYYIIFIVSQVILQLTYMNVRTKFDKGKQINRSQSGSWQARCAGAGLRINKEQSGVEVLTTPSGTFTKVAQSKSKKVEKDHKEKSTDKVRNQRKRAKRVSQVE